MRELWRIELLGALRVRHGEGAWLRLPPGKPGALLARLAYSPQRPHPREELIELLWPEGDPEAGRHNLRGILYALRRLLATAGGPTDDWLGTDRATVTLSPTHFTSDVADLRAALAAAAHADTPSRRVEALARAVDLYRGELLPGFFEPWVLQEREHLLATHLETLRQLVQAREESGDLAGALAAARQAVQVDPLREEVHYDLMRLYAATGQPSACLQQYQELARILREEFGEQPSSEARALAESLRESARTVVVARPSPPAAPAEGPTAPDLPPASEPEAPAPSLPRGSRLPVQLTPFFGREEEIARLTELLSSPVTRLVTLTGPGGSGKTRLAIAVAGRLQGQFTDAVAFVPLADLGDAAQIPSAIADALDLPRHPNLSPLEQAATYLRGRPWLLVLDNFEHLVEAGARCLRSLLAEVETLTCLVTSRQRLALAGEQELPVPPLPTPVEGLWLRVEGPTKTGFSDPSTINHQLSTLEQCASVQLFLDRARAARPGFELTSDNAAAVAQLCHRLEGLPLALELAAGRLSALAPAQMLALVQERFTFLTGRQRDLPERHRSLRAAIDTSYHMLAPELQRFFARLSVFRGGWTLEAAEAVCSGEDVQAGSTRSAGGGGPTGGAGPRASGVQDGAVLPPERLNARPGTRETGGARLALDCLEQLRECSLIQVEESGDAVRYRMLETLREYGGEQLVASTELAAARNRHRDWFLQLAEQLGAAADRPEEAAWLARLEAELDNLRAALAWCREAADADAESAGAEAGLRLAVALLRFWQQRGYIAEGLQWVEGALARSGHLSPTLRARAFEYAAFFASPRGSDQSRSFLRSARAEQEKVLKLARAAGTRAEIAQAVVGLAGIAHQIDDVDAAWELGQEAREHMEALGDRLGLVRALRTLAALAVLRGERAAARPLSEEALAICRELGESETLIHTLGFLGHLARDEEDYPRARSLYVESLALRREAGYWLALAQSLEDFAVLAGRERHARRAIRLLGAAEAFCETLDARPPVADDTDYERTVAEGRAALGEAAFAAAWAEGRALSLEQAVEYALDEG